MMGKIWARFVRSLKHENEMGMWYWVSLEPLYRPRLTFGALAQRLSRWSFILLFGGAIIGVMGHTFVMMMVWLAAFAFILRTLRSMFSRSVKLRPIQGELVLFMDNNGLAEFADGQVISEAAIRYAEYPQRVVVRYFKTGDRYQAGADKQGDLLESALGLELVRQADGITEGRAGKKAVKYVEYTFNKVRGEHYVVQAMPVEETALKFKVSDGFVVDLRQNYSQLVSGASGAGKSYYTYFYLTRFISQAVASDGVLHHAQLFAIDPKMSDLYKLCQVSGMPADHYGSTNGEAFAIAKRFRAEVERRKEIYRASTKFDTVAVDLGLPPLLLVIEEFSSLITSMDKKQRADFEAMLMQIVQMGRQLSMGLLVVMQSPKSEDLNTSIRANLATAVHLGTPTAQVAQMMFNTSDLPPLGNDKGVGLVSLEKAAPIKFRAPEFGVDVFEAIMPVWKSVAGTYATERDNEETESSSGSSDWSEFL